MTWLRRGSKIGAISVSFAASVLILLALARGDRGPAVVGANARSQSSQTEEARALRTGSMVIASSRDFTAFVDQVNGVNVASKDTVIVPVYTVSDGGPAKPQFAVRTCVTLGREATAKERFQAYVQWLSLHVYQGNQIVLVRLDSEGATVDLRAPREYVGKHVFDYWHQRFQGSAGGSQTETELLVNLTQPGLDMEWPRQVEVRYQGNPCNFDHTSYLDTAVQRAVMSDLLAERHWEDTGE